MGYLVFFTYKICPVEEGLFELCDEHLEYVMGDKYINASDNIIIEDALNLSDAYKKDGSPIIIIDKKSFEDNLVKVIRLYYNHSPGSYVCHRSTISKLEDSIFLQEGIETEYDDGTYPFYTFSVYFKDNDYVKEVGEEGDIIISELF